MLGTPLYPDAKRALNKEGLIENDEDMAYHACKNVKLSPVITLPKSELHIHLESAISPALLKNFAKAQHKELPRELFTADGENYYLKNFTELHHLYDFVASFLTTPEDFYQLAYSYLQHLTEDGAIYAELIIAPGYALAHGISYSQLIESYAKAIDDARRDFGIESRLLLALIRHQGLNEAKKALDQALYERHPYLSGVNLVGDVTQYPLKIFLPLYEKAASAGLGCTIHVGETFHPFEYEEMQLVLDHFPITRIGHGIRAVDSPPLLEKILEKNIVMEISLSSNVLLQFSKDYASHPLSIFKNLGIKYCLNTDDSYLMNTTLQREHQLAQMHLNLTKEDLLCATKTAIEAAFVPENIKQQLLHRIAEASARLPVR